MYLDWIKTKHTYLCFCGDTNYIHYIRVFILQAWQEFSGRDFALYIVVVRCLHAGRLKMFAHSRQNTHTTPHINTMSMANHCKFLMYSIGVLLSDARTVCAHQTAEGWAITRYYTCVCGTCIYLIYIFINSLRFSISWTKCGNGASKSDRWQIDGKKI